MASSPVSSVAEVHTDKVLSTFATEYRPRGLIGLQLLPPIPVAEKSGSYRKRNKDMFLREQNGDLGAVGLPAEVGAGYDTAEFACKNYGFEAPVPAEFERSADVPLNLRMDATKMAKIRVAMLQERRIVTLLEATGSYASGNYTTLSGTDQWSDKNNSDPFNVIRQYMRAIYASPDAKKIGWCSQEVWDVLVDHPDIVERLKFGGSTADPARVSRKAFAALFELDDMLVSDAMSTSTNAGQAASYSRMYGKHFGVVAVEGASTMFTGFGATFVWQPEMVTETFDSRPGLLGVTRIKVAHSVAEVTANNDSACLIKSAVA